MKIGNWYISNNDTVPTPSLIYELVKINKDKKLVELSVIIKDDRFKKTEENIDDTNVISFEHFDKHYTIFDDTHKIVLINEYIKELKDKIEG